MIDQQDVLKMVKKLLTFPYPQICRHLVACDLLSLLESKGWECPPDLATFVVQCKDEEAIEEVDKFLA